MPTLTGYNPPMPQIAQDVLENRSQTVKTQARTLGFDACGVASANAPIDPENRLSSWLARGFQADMHWMTRTEAARGDVCERLPGARSVIVVARNYYSARESVPEGSGKVATYAWGRDYHNVLKKPLRRLASRVAELEPDAQTYASIDTGPVLERAWAQRAGVGAIGKNSLALRRDMGSWFFLATILTTVELEPDPPAEDLCGTCTLCLDACPSSAIVEPYVVDSNRCVSYQTIENRADIPDDMHEHHRDWIFGCDICQEVCPWNRFQETTTEADFLPRPGHANPNLDDLITMQEDAFLDEFTGTPIRRAKHAGMQRNARIARANQS